MAKYIQKCWTCANACNRNNCIWVKTLRKRPKGVVLDKRGYIIECPSYEHDRKLYTNKEKAQALGIVFEKYMQLKNAIIKHGLKLSVMELFAQINTLNIDLRKYITLRNQLLKYGFKMSVAEYLKKTEKSHKTVYQLAKLYNKISSIEGDKKEEYHE